MPSFNTFQILKHAFYMGELLFEDDVISFTIVLYVQSMPPFVHWQEFSGYSSSLKFSAGLLYPKTH